MTATQRRRCTRTMVGTECPSSPKWSGWGKPKGPSLCQARTQIYPLVRRSLGLSGDHGDPEEAAKQQRDVIKFEAWKASFPKVSAAQKINSLSKAPQDGPALDGYLEGWTPWETSSPWVWLCSLVPTYHASCTLRF